MRTSSIAAEAGEFRDLVLRRHHDPGTATIEPVAQFIRRQQRGRGDHHHAELHCRQHGLPQRNDIAEQQQKMVAALQALRAQEVCDLVGTARQRGERELCLAVAAGIDDPQRGAVLAFGLRASSASNQSSAQLNGTGSGQRNPFTAAS